MRYDKMPTAEARAGDSAIFISAIEALLKAGANPRRPPNNSHQIKVTSNVSFYPNTGTILVDGASGALPIRGVQALIEYLHQNGVIALPAQV
jgi:hypothetical protein